MSAAPVPVTDKGRRRRRLNDEGEDEDVEISPVIVRPSECESEGETPDIQDLSEYESTVEDAAGPGEESEEESETETEEGSETESESGSGSETEGGEEYSDEEGIEEERQSGDGEEQPNNDKPDDDEDKKNPAYVPRKGAFYEHDFRHGDEGPSVQEVADDSKPKKKLWQDEGKWSHDRYSDDLQAPKTREELIALYGYDIRAADKPPEAPPKRPGRDKGPRKQRMQDFIPRMAVIDTTEDGSDSVPALGGELILYDGTSPPSVKRNNTRNAESKRGGMGYKRASGDVDKRNNRNNQYGDSKYNSEPEMWDDPSTQEVLSQDFPSLEDSTKSSVARESENGDKPRSDNKQSSERGPKSYPADARDVNFRKDNRENNKNVKMNQSQDVRRYDDSNRYQQGYREDKRGGFNNRPVGRDGDFNRGVEENWRSSPKDPRDNRGGDFNSDYNYNRRSQQSYRGRDKGPRTGNPAEGDRYSYNNRNNRYEQPPRYQQQKGDASSAKETREYTNTTYRSTEDKTKQRNSYNASAVNTENIVGENGDGSSSQNVVFSNKENVQTINVTITSTTTEKKSYAKERRAKGSSRLMEGATMVGHPEQQNHGGTGLQYHGPPPGQIKLESNSVPSQTGAKRYSSQRQQGHAKGVYSEPPPIDSGANLYNPALPPPSFYREHGSVAPGQHPTPSSPGVVQEAAHYPPTLITPTAALPYGLPVSSTVLPIPPNTAGIAPNAALFQPPTGPPPVGVLGPQYLPAGLMYGGAARVPPPGTATGFTMPMAYTSPPPTAAGVVGGQPPPLGNVPQQSMHSTAHHKKVYRGDITYYSPELQQPSRTPQKRPKAAIPIIDPQEMRRQKQKSEQRTTPEKSSPSKQSAPSISNTVSKGVNAHPHTHPAKPGVQLSEKEFKQPVSVHNNTDSSRLDQPVSPKTEIATESLQDESQITNGMNSLALNPEHSEVNTQSLSMDNPAESTLSSYTKDPLLNANNDSADIKENYSMPTAPVSSSDEPVKTEIVIDSSDNKAVMEIKDLQVAENLLPQQISTVQSAVEIKTEL